jgi:hypothetical protein
MIAFSNILRQSLVASLLAGLTTAGLPPCLVAGANCQAAASAKAKPCCCQGKCAQHCRMACCQSPNPPQDRAPAPTRLTDDASVIWGLAPAAVGAIVTLTRAEARPGSSGPVFSLATGDSLRELCIRLNV